MSSSKFNSFKIFGKVLHISIRRVISLKNFSAPDTIPTHAFTSPDGLAVDWVANNLYWTDLANKVTLFDCS